MCKYKEVDIFEGNMMPDNLSLLLSIPPKNKCVKFYGVFERKKVY
ncbi:MAG: hypothetical protein IJA55_05145 [Clostridia bacterium]|nr:hypothetical protein [Clostridia bacterium]